MIEQHAKAEVSSKLARTVAKADRILRDELRHGCGDRLVEGGLEKFLRYWVAELHRVGTPPAYLDHAERVLATLSSYAQFSLAERRKALQKALGLLENAREPGAPTSPRELTEDDGGRTQEQKLSSHSGSPQRTNTQPSKRSPADTPLDQLKGVGPARARALARLSLRRYGDLLRHYPSRHEHYPPAKPASELIFLTRASFEGVVKDVHTSVLNRGLRKVSARLSDATGLVAASWLRAGFSGPKLAPGQRIAVSGDIVACGRQIAFENPDWEPANGEPTHTRRMVPIYPLTAGIHPYWLRARIHEAVNAEAPNLPDFLPDSVRASAQLPDLGWATAQIHFPDDPEALERARKRLAFDELFLIQMVVMQRRLRWRAQAGCPLPAPREGLEVLLGAQPFQLTTGQLRAVEEINADLARSIPMSRLLQGEVGSGKTAVAAVALFVAVGNGGQGVLMAPTEILAEQHFRTLTEFYGRAADGLASRRLRAPRVALLTGSATRRQKKAIQLALRGGEIDILVGTHAVIQEGVEPLHLALSVIDEQHRFGVRQRVGLREKGQNPHLLVMTATPIPRTLALSLHGDLDLSLIEELPPGRHKTKTVLLRPMERPLAYEHVRREASRGRQTFLICPLIEDSANLEARAATEEYERLSTTELAGLRLGLLHGRMRSVEKDEVMRRFRDGGFDVLVSTSVVEVGVDVPNATTMLIEGAERFGLAQLHQFRGRVGRGEDAATCILLSDIEGDAIERLSMLVRSDNGLELAEYDLRQRGPGDFFGVRQSGLPELKVATFDDVGLVEQARGAAIHVLETDPDLTSPEHALLAERVAEFVHRVGEPN